MNGDAEIKLLAGGLTPFPFQSYFLPDDHNSWSSLTHEDESRGWILELVH
jgi:hypothetical protein